MNHQSFISFFRFLKHQQVEPPLYLQKKHPRNRRSHPWDFACLFGGNQWWRCMLKTRLSKPHFWWWFPQQDVRFGYILKCEKKRHLSRGKIERSCIQASLFFLAPSGRNKSDGFSNVTDFCQKSLPQEFLWTLERNSLTTWKIYVYIYIYIYIFFFFSPANSLGLKDVGRLNKKQQPKWRLATFKHQRISGQKSPYDFDSSCKCRNIFSVVWISASMSQDPYSLYTHTDRLVLPLE